MAYGYFVESSGLCALRGRNRPAFPGLVHHQGSQLLAPEYASFGSRDGFRLDCLDYLAGLLAGHTHHPAFRCPR